MGIHGKSISFFYNFFSLAICASLLACSGAAPGGAGGPPSGGGTAPFVAGSNSLDAGNPGTVPPLPGNDLAQGQAVPSTQQSEPGMAGPCLIHFVVTVKVTRRGAELSCTGEPMELTRRRAFEAIQPGADTVAPPEDPGVGPEVTFTFTTPSDIEDRVVKAPTTCGPDGRWQTGPYALGFHFIPDGLKCHSYSIRTHASWTKGESTFSSDTFVGPPVPVPDEATGVVPVPLHIELEAGKFIYEGVQTILGR